MDGSFWVMFFPARRSSVTAPPVQFTSGQSQGEDEEDGVDDWRPSWCLRVTRMVCSVVVGCEIT